MSRLVAFGCSHTYGSGMPDSFNLNKPSNLAWSGILAQMLDLEHVNLGWEGASNKRIWHQILHADLNQDDIVVIQWTYTIRFCFFWPDFEKTVDSNYKRINLGGFSNKSKMSSLTENDHEFARLFYHEYDLETDTMNRIQGAQDYLTRQNIKFWHMPFIIPDYVNWKPRRWFVPENIVMMHIDQVRRRHGKNLDGQHMAESAHCEIADAFYEKINHE